MEEYLRLKYYPEVPEVLKRIKGRKKAIFSNGALDMLKSLVQFAGLNILFDDILSTDEVKVYKPDPKAYTVVLEKFNISREEILFVSSNPWDVAGGKSFGFHVAWVNRENKTFDKLDQTPDLIIQDLSGLLVFLAG